MGHVREVQIFYFSGVEGDGQFQAGGDFYQVRHRCGRAHRNHDMVVESGQESGYGGGGRGRGEIHGFLGEVGREDHPVPFHGQFSPGADEAFRMIEGGQGAVVVLPRLRIDVKTVLCDLSYLSREEEDHLLGERRHGGRRVGELFQVHGEGKNHVRKGLWSPRFRPIRRRRPQAGPGLMP